MPIEPPVPGGSGARVLLVDDNVDAVESLQVLLEAFGVVAEVAIDPYAALDALDRQVPAAAVIDIGLPGMDGHELATRMLELCRATGRTPPRLVALTGYGGPQEAARAAEAGFSAHLVKPVNIEQLLKELGC